VPLLDAGEAEGVSFIAFAYVADSETLSSRLERTGTLDPAEIVAIARQIGSALDAMHTADMVHRDVKPSNVILSQGTALLSDLGLVRGAGYTALTRPGRVLGTADYLAPELIRGVPAGAASDIYAFGCTLFEGAVGTPPFGGRSMLAVGIAHLEEAPPDPATIRPELPPAFSSALLRALAKEPSDRPATALAYSDLLASGL
jgi:serine/threonine-protein kinase